MIQIAGMEIEARETVWGWGWNDPMKGPIIFVAEDEEEARDEAYKAGGSVICREVFLTAWADAPDEPSDPDEPSGVNAPVA